MNKIMAVYDIDPFYADRFADFVNQKEKVPFSVMAFTSLERLRDYAMRQTISLLVISQAVGREEISKIPAEQTVVLSDGEVIPIEDEYPSIYKYQSTDSIIREVMACYCENPVQEIWSAVSRKGTVIGVYSPVNRCLKTSFSLTLGQVMAKDSKVLYINLEECSGLQKMTGDYETGNLSDVLYYYRQGNYNYARLGSVIHSWGNLDYLPPVKYPEDLCQITAEEMSDLLNKIAVESTYDAIIVDIGQFGKKSAQVLEICDVIYMPVKDDCISVAKLEEFEEYLEAAEKMEVVQKIQKLKLPYHSSFGRRETYLEQLVWGELGDYVRQLLKGRQWSWN